MTKSDDKVKAAFHEVTVNPPAIVQHTARKFGSSTAKRQRVAIALSKARRAGASVPTRGGKA